MNFRKAGLIIVILLAVAVVLLNRKDVTLTEQSQFEFHTIGATGGELQSTIRLDNPNLLSSTITNIYERFYLNGILLGILDNQISQGIPGRQETSFPVAIRFSRKDYEDALRIDTTGKAELRIQGEITFENLTGGDSIKVQQVQTISVKEL